MVLPMAVRAPTVQSSGLASTAKLTSRLAHADSHHPNNSRVMLLPGHSVHSAISQRAPALHHATASAVVAAAAATAPLAPAPSQDQHAHGVPSLFPRSAANQVKRNANRSTQRSLPSEPGFSADLPLELQALLDPSAPVRLPSAKTRLLQPSHGKKLDQLIAQLGRSKATWRRALVLYEWLKEGVHAGLMDARLCTTLIRVCALHRDAVSALSIYDWMRSPEAAGGGGLQPTVFTYSELLRATLAAKLLDRGMQVWQDARAASIVPDSHMCIAYMELCVRLQRTDQALAMYAQMRAAPAGSAMAPTAHAYTAAMKAACEGGLWARALEIWGEMEAAGCPPSAHAYTAAMRACAAACDWPRALALFRTMTSAGIKPDVVSCTALMKALASTGEADKAEAVLQWMLREGMAPNVNAYTVLMTAMGNAKQWGRAVELLYKMQLPEWGQVQPNAYTYSVLIKLLGDHSQWQLAEAVFGHAEQQVLATQQQQQQQGQSQQGQGQGRPSQQQRLQGGREPFLAQGPIALGAGAGAGALTGQEVGMRGTGLALPVGGQADGAWVRPSQLNGISLNLGQLTAGAPTPPEQQLQQQQEQEQQQQPGGAPGAVGSSSSGSSNGAGSAGPAGFSLFSSAGLSNTGSSSHGNGSGGGSGALAMLQRPSHRAHANGAESTQLPATAAGAAEQRWAGSQQGSAVLGQGSDHSRSDLEAAEDPEDAGAVHARGFAQGQGVLQQQPIVNAVVCGALMRAYEQAGMWAEAVGVLARARTLGLQPNTVMFNTAIASAGKAGQLQLCEQLFALVRKPDIVTYEAMINAYGYCGQPVGAESMYQSMINAGFTRPRDYAYCGLIAAYTLAGDTDRALLVRQRVRRNNGGAEAPSLRVYNALLAACRHGRRAEQALSLLAEMKRLGLEPDAVTSQLMNEVGRQGVQSVEGQQAALAAISAAMAAAGGILIQRGLF